MNRDTSVVDNVGADDAANIARITKEWIRDNINPR
jgi:hypothetical protein